MKPNKTLVFSNKTMKVRFALGHKLTQNSVDLSRDAEMQVFSTGLIKKYRI